MLNYVSITMGIMALNGTLKTTNNNLAGGTKNASGNGIVKSNGTTKNGGTIERGGIIRNDGTIPSLIHMVFCYIQPYCGILPQVAKKLPRGPNKKTTKLIRIST